MPSALTPKQMAAEIMRLEGVVHDQNKTIGSREQSIENWKLEAKRFREKYENELATAAVWKGRYFEVRRPILSVAYLVGWGSIVIALIAIVWAWKPC